MTKLEKLYSIIENSRDVCNNDDVSTRFENSPNSTF